MMKKYLPAEIEPKWQKKWEEMEIYASDLSKPRKFYALAEFPYPSGDLHMGHWFTFSGADFYARLKRMQGFNVFFPNGFDAFGLPAENAAIKHHIHPQDWTMSNIDRMRRQFASMGGSFTFDHEVITATPQYYKWNQWIFLQMFKKDLAYRGKYLSNWCNVCQTVLANEGVEAGTCWRCHSEVVQKEVDQWFLTITSYAERLLWLEEISVDWPKALRDAQNSWIGKSEGILIKFPNTSSQTSLEVFTTRPDTLFGVTFIAISPEHPLLGSFVSSQQKELVANYQRSAAKKSELERKENKEKSGVFLGSSVNHPLTDEPIPLWVADYVLASYGTGAVMGVPAHDQRDFEFAKKHGLQIKEVISPQTNSLRKDQLQQAYEGEGVLVNSKSYNEMTSQQAKDTISDYLVKHQLGTSITYYHLHDWSISRQRYWGTPIPIIYCDKCQIVPVPEEELPVELPYDVDYTPQGKPPLASNEEWLKVKCPKCGSWGRRESETMDTFIDSSWYFFRYLDPKLNTAPFDKELARKIMPVDVYFGGAEHTLGHTLYARFFTKFLHDLGLTDLEEFAAKRVNHGVVLGSDGYRMSKSRGNVVNPDEEVKKFGADTIRVYLAFFMPYEATGPWIPERIWGAYRFLERVWKLFEKVTETKPGKKDLELLNKTIRKVEKDIESIKFNTAVAALMEWLNHLSRKAAVSNEEYKTLLLLLVPFAPHITEELWQMLGCSPAGESIHQQSWPKFDSKLLEEEVIVVVQVNGKVRDQLIIEKGLGKKQQEVENLAKLCPKVQKFLEGREVKNTVYVPGKVLNFVTT